MGDPLSRKERRRLADEKRAAIKDELWGCIKKEYDKTKDFEAALKMGDRAVNMMIARDPRNADLIRSSGIQLANELEEKILKKVSDNKKEVKKRG